MIERPLVAVSGPQIQSITGDLNDRFHEKQTVRIALPQIAF
jgi:hypothetical protein